MITEPITGDMFTPAEALRVVASLCEQAEAEAVALDRLDLLSQVESLLDSAVRGGVAEARAGGASWQQIANALGLASKQAAQQRYGARDA